MSGIQTSRGQEKFITPLKDYTQEQSSDLLEFVTGQNVGGKKRAIDVVNYGTYPVSTGNLVEAGSTQRKIIKTAHGARKNDIVSFTTGLNAGVAIQILSCPTDDLLILAATPDETTAIGDEFSIKRYVSPQYDSTGALNVISVQSPAKFVRDSVETEVEEDTVTPANNRPFPGAMFIKKDDGNYYPVTLDTTNPYAHTPIPVAITDVTGTTNVTINAGDIAVGIKHNGADPSSVRIGDGTELVEVTTSNELMVKQGGLAPFYNQDLTIEELAVVTIVKPAGAKKAKVWSDSLNEVRLRVTMDGLTAPTSTIGMPFEPGRSEDFDGVGDLKVIAESNPLAAQAIYVHWSI